MVSFNEAPAKIKNILYLIWGIALIGLIGGIITAITDKDLAKFVGPIVTAVILAIVGWLIIQDGTVGLVAYIIVAIIAIVWAVQGILNLLNGFDIGSIGSILGIIEIVLGVLLAIALVMPDMRHYHGLK